ncbi:hypothetical protein AGMMS49546_33640 [Spirochaetia bacterium]|nr:hypothetical protein AGMMS49546_33640 [Spirochaetia bacterium]
MEHPWAIMRNCKDFYKRWHEKEYPNGYVLGLLTPYQKDLEERLANLLQKKAGLREYSLEANRLKYEQNEITAVIKYIKAFIDELEEKMVGQATEPPFNKNIDNLTKGNDPVLRSWTGGKYKCNSLERFITAYIKIMDNLTANLITDYLISERTGKPYSHQTIETNMKIHGPGRKSN